MNKAQGNTRLARQLVWFFAILDAVVLFAAMCGLAAGQSGWLVVLLLLMVASVAVGAYAVRQGLVFERRVERIWKAVCGGIGFKGEARSYRNGLNGAYRKGETKTIYPRLREVHGSRESFTAYITPFGGQDTSDYNKYAEKFAFAFMVPSVSFEAAEDGRIRLYAGKVPVPAVHEFQAIPQPGGDGRDEPGAEARMPIPVPDKLLSGSAHVLPAIQSVYAYSQPAAFERERALLRAVPMAVDMQGKWWSMPIEGTHILVAARTCGGKGSWVWSLVLRLEPAYRQGLVKFWGCDPKRLELAIGADWWAHYADKDVAMVELLEQAVQEMYAVGDTLKGKARKFTASQQTPLNIVVIDELGYLSSLLTDRKLQTRADNAIKTLLTQGRANSFSVVGCVQDPRKSTVEYRDQFPVRICGGLDNADMVDLILGKGMHDAGAVAERIPIGREGAGVAFVLDVEQAMKPRLVRAAWVSDATIRDALSPRVRAQVEAYEVRDEQLGFNGLLFQQFNYRVE